MARCTPPATCRAPRASRCPTVSKILKALARAGLLASHRGVGGGFALARDGKTITVADVVTALEGPIALTACLSPDRESCTVENSCPVKPNWERLNDAVRAALQSISVAEMVVPRFQTSSTSRLHGAGARAGTVVRRPPRAALRGVPHRPR